MRTRALITSFLLPLAATLTAAASPASAQPAPVAQPAPAPAAQPAPAAAAAPPSPKDVERATAHFLKGSELFAAKKYELALAEFQASYAAVASPNSRLYVARSLELLGKHRAAYVEFEKVEAEASARAAAEPKYAPTAETARTERAEIAAKLAWLTVRVRGAGDDARVQVGGAVVAREAWEQPVAVEPGEIVVSVDAPPNPSVSQTLTLQAGERREVELDVTPKVAAAPPAPTAAPVSAQSGDRASTLRIASFVAGGVGVVGLGLFIGAGASANSTYSDLESACGNRPCPDSRQGDIDSGKSMQTLANVGLVIGGVGLGAGVTLFLLSRSSSKTADAVASHLVLAPGYGGLRGEF